MLLQLTKQKTFCYTSLEHDNAVSSNCNQNQKEEQDVEGECPEAHQSRKSVKSDSC